MTHTPLHRALAKALTDAHITTVFGLMGDGNLWLIDTFVRECGGHYVAATHEAHAITMASGYAKRSGGLGVATVTHGPGLTNTVTALVDASRARHPLLVIIGDTPADQLDHSQRLLQREVVAATGAGFEQVTAPGAALEAAARAIRRAVTERRPVVLNIPRPFLLEEVAEADVSLAPPPPQSIAPDTDLLDDALGVIASARRPLILAGRGAAHAKRELIALADRTGALLATTLQGQGMFRGHPYNLGIFGSLSSQVALEAIEGVDAVVVFGASLNRHTTVEGSLLSGKTVVHIDRDPGAFALHALGEVCLQADAKTAAISMEQALQEAGISGTGARTEQLAAALAAHASRELASIGLHGDVDPRIALHALAQATDSRRTVVTDLGRFVIDAWQTFTVREPEQYVHTNNFGSIGLGMGYAIGASYAAPDEPVVLVTGDGGHLMGGVTELFTAIRHGRKLVVVVVNDGAYGAEHVQFRNRGIDPQLATHPVPDFAALATTMGAVGVSVREMADLPAAVAALERVTDVPLVIDLHVHPEDVLSRGYA